MLVGLSIVAGIACLYFGGDLLVGGGANLGKRAGISHLVIGLTIVSLGTSMPELATTLEAASRGSTEMAFGNVLGSNVANIGLALGLAAILQPLAASRAFMVRDVPTMLVSTALLWPLAKDGTVYPYEGAILLCMLVLYLSLLGWMAQRDRTGFDDMPEDADSVAMAGGKLVIGIGMLLVGAEALIYGGVEAARAMEISERVIGLTLVALGTSLPEIASTVVACVRGEGGIAVGNVVGSNIFNVLAILGTTASVHPVSLDTGHLPVDLGAVLVLSVLVPVFAARGVMGRFGGAVLVLLYVGYIASLIVRG